ncbi:hypothetical protein ACQ4PT_064381 [Festuca glaucescens]
MAELLRVIELKGIEDGDDLIPAFTLPSHPDRLVVFDPDLQQLCLLRSENYISKGDKCKIIEAVRSTALDLIMRSQSNTIRAVYYKIEDICPKHEQSDNAIRELCLLSESTRASLNMVGTPQGSISGPIILTANGEDIDCEHGGLAGMKIPLETELDSGITSVKPKGEVNFILIVEKEAVFLVLKKLSFDKKQRCVLITRSGQPDTMTKIALNPHSGTQEDFIAWHFDKKDGENGNFNWKKLWSLPLPGKVLHFLWRVTTYTLPLRMKLHHREEKSMHLAWSVLRSSAAQASTADRGSDGAR